MGRISHYICLGAGIATATFMLTGCSTEEADTIRVMSCSDWIKESEVQLGKSFEAETGIYVEYEYVDANVYQEELLKRIENGEVPDIFLAQSGFALDTTYKVQENAIDLSEESWMEYYDEFSQIQTSVNGHNYGMTYYDTTTDYYFVYNKQLLKRAGFNEPPKTFEEFTAMCEALKSIGVTPIYEPVADGWHQTMLWADSGQVFEKIEPGLIDRLNKNEEKFSENENMLKALSQIKLLADKGYFGDDYKNATYDQTFSYLASGEYAMAFLKPGAIGTIVSNEMNTGYKESDFGLMLFPVCDNKYLNVHPTGPSRFIAKKSKNIEGAKKYLEYLAKKESIQYMIDKDDAIENLPFDVGQKTDYSSDTNFFFEQYDTENSGLVLQDTVKYYNEQWGEISADLALMFEGKLTEKQVLDNVDTRRAELAIKAGDECWK